MDTDLMGEIVGDGEVKAPVAERSTGNRCSCEVQLHELG